MVIKQKTPFWFAGISVDNGLQLRDCPQNKDLPNKRSFEGKCEILLTIHKWHQIGRKQKPKKFSYYFGQISGINIKNVTIEIFSILTVFSTKSPPSCKTFSLFRTLQFGICLFEVNQIYQLRLFWNLVVTVAI